MSQTIRSGRLSEAWVLRACHAWSVIDVNEDFTWMFWGFFCYFNHMLHADFVQVTKKVIYCKPVESTLFEVTIRTCFGSFSPNAWVKMIYMST